MTWRYTTQPDCTRLWRWYDRVGPAERAGTTLDCTRAPAVALPPGPAAPLLPAAPVAGLSRRAVLGGLGGAAAGTTAIAAGIATGRLVPGWGASFGLGAASPHHPASLTDGAHFSTPSAWANSAPQQTIGVRPGPLHNELYRLDLPPDTVIPIPTPGVRDDAPRAVPEPSSGALLVLPVLVAVGMMRRGRG